MISAPPESADRAGFLSARWVVVALVLVTALAAAMRFWRLGAIPPGFHYDESLEALEAWRVLTVPGYHPVYFPGDFGLAPMFIYLDSLAFRFIAPLPVVTRAIAAVIGTLTVPALYGLGREMRLTDESIPPATPLAGAFILAILPWHITFSRIGIEPVLVPLFLVLILWTLLKALRSNRRLAWVAAGLTLGLCVYTYPAAWLLPPFWFLAILYLALVARGRLSGRGRGLALAAILAALIALPLVLPFAQHPAQMLARIGQVEAVGTPGSSGGALATIGTNTVKALGLFSFAGDIDPRNNIPGSPALDPLLGGAFYAGVIVAIWRWRRSVAAILLLAAAAMLADTIFSQYTPHFRRAIGLTAVIPLLSGLGLGVILGRQGERAVSGRERAAGDARLWRGARMGAVLAILVGSAFLSVTAYFERWASSPDLFYAYDEGLSQIAEYVKTLPPGEEIFITPQSVRHPTLAFAWRNGPLVRSFDGRKAIVAPGIGQGANYVVIEHEDFRATGVLRELYPDAREVKTFLDRENRVYARVWHVPAGAARGCQPENVTICNWPGLQLTGYDLDKPVYHPGDIVYLQLWWQATAPVSTDWTVFSHLLGSPRGDGSVLWAGEDHRPGDGSVPTTTWMPGDLILDEYQIPLAKDTPAGDYQIEVGLYDLKASAQRAMTLDPPGQNHVVLGTVRVQ